MEEVKGADKIVKKDDKTEGIIKTDKKEEGKEQKEKKADAEVIGINDKVVKVAKVEAKPIEAEKPNEKGKQEEKQLEKPDEKEMKIRAITNIYYSNPKVQDAMISFSLNREVVPRYYEGFGKRPDALLYPSDIIGLVKRGATSFHASEELWADPLQINSEMTQEEMSNVRTGWDLVIDIDSPYLDYSKVAARLMIDALEKHGIKNYGLKFSGNKGFHIIISKNAFPKEFDGLETRRMFPDWARAVCEYLVSSIRPIYNKEVGGMMGRDEIKAIEAKTKDKISEVLCPECGRASKKGIVVTLTCPICGMKIERKDIKLTKKRLKCLNANCAGVLEVQAEKDYFFCEYCSASSFNRDKSDEGRKGDWSEEISANKIAGLDLVLVSPRHLFRMPYSLHEKTALASVVISKEEIDKFSPKDANPLNVKIKDFLPKNFENEALGLLRTALDWKKTDVKEEETANKKKYENSEFKEIDASNLSESDFPKPIKKLLKGLQEGKKRGLFILMTFLRRLNFSPDYINNKVREWNKFNEPPLKEGYIKSQIDWLLKQKKKILPPNYDNASFYKDLNLLDEVPKAKNPISEVTRKIWAKERGN